MHRPITNKQSSNQAISSGSTIVILKALYESSLGIKKDINKQLLNQAIVLDAITAEAINRNNNISDIPSQLGKTADGVRASLAPLNNKLNVDQYNNFSGKFQSFEEKAADSHARYKKFIEDHSYIFTVQKSVKTLLTEQSQGKVSLEKVQQMLQDTQKKIKTFTSSLTSYEKEYLALQTNLDNLHGQVFHAVPPDQRGTLPLPAYEEERATRRLG
jgi:hypothetical protein